MKWAKPSDITREIPPDPRGHCEESLPPEHVKKHIDKLTWGTVGKDGNQPLNTKKLSELTTDHLENIICNMPLLDQMTKRVIIEILKIRYAGDDDMLDAFFKLTGQGDDSTGGKT